MIHDALSCVAMAATGAEHEFERAMQAAIAEAERARGSTGDNPWVGSVIVDERGAIVARGHTQGPGEDHAEIVAIHEAQSNAVDLARVTLYSTLEPCAFHGRTPACARAIVTAGVRRVVTGIRDPNPRVDGAGIQILRDAGIEVVENVCASAISHQLGDWIFRFHPHEPLRRALAWFASNGSREETARLLREHYGVAATSIDAVISQLGGR